MSMDMLNHNKKINKALNLLSEAAEETKSEIGEGFHRVQRMTTDAIQESGEKIRKTAHAMDRKVRKNPWAVIGGVAATSLLLGYVFGVFKRK